MSLNSVLHNALVVFLREDVSCFGPATAFGAANKCTIVDKLVQRWAFVQCGDVGRTNTVWALLAKAIFELYA